MVQETFLGGWINQQKSQKSHHELKASKKDKSYQHRIDETMRKHVRSPGK